MADTDLTELPTPIRAAEWYEKDDRVVVIRPPVGQSWLSPRRWYAAVFEPRRWRLDELGSFCWRRLDGERTLGQLADDVRETHGQDVEAIEERIRRFVQVLVREGMVRLPPADDPEEPET